MRFKASHSPMKISICLSALSVGMFAMFSAHAKQDDRNQPIQVVRADHADVHDQANSVSTLTGDVLVTQGTTKLTGELVKIYTAKEDTSIDHVVSTGTVTKRPHIEQLDDNNNLMTGDADQLYYDEVNGVAILTGDAFVHHQGQAEAHGAKLTYNTITGDMVAERDASAPITMTFYPKQRTMLLPKASESPSPSTSAAGAGHQSKD
jgi:lipopolysaccharide export system protein LptA